MGNPNQSPEGPKNLALVKVSEARIVTYCDFCPGDPEEPAKKTKNKQKSREARYKCTLSRRDMCPVHGVMVEQPHEIVSMRLSSGKTNDFYRSMFLRERNEKTELLPLASRNLPRML